MGSWYWTVGNTSASITFLGQPPHPTPTVCTSDPTPQPKQGLPDMPPQQPNQGEVSPELELMELDVPDDI